MFTTTLYSFHNFDKYQPFPNVKFSLQSSKKSTCSTWNVAQQNMPPLVTMASHQPHQPFQPHVHLCSQEDAFSKVDAFDGHMPEKGDDPWHSHSAKSVVMVEIHNMLSFKITWWNLKMVFQVQQPDENNNTTTNTQLIPSLFCFHQH